MTDKASVCGKDRSIVRKIGSYLQFTPYAKIYIITPRHSNATNSIINENSNSDLSGFNGGRLSGSKPDLLEPISFESEIRLLALEQKIQDLNSKVSCIVKSTINKEQSHHSSTVSLSNGNSSKVNPPPPPPPLPLPLPSTPHIARRSSLQDHKLEERKKPLAPQKSMGDMLKDLDKIKLKPIERSPGGRPLRAAKRENSPRTDLEKILRERYHAMRSPDSRNSSALNIDDSF